jgi:hypothetical protein
MSQVIELSKSVKDICTVHPDVIEILKELGFEQITSAGMLNTVGRFMTIPKGAAMRGIPLEKIKTKFAEKGFELKE